jgi:predicted DNA binding CopG/RHH family protein
VIEIKKDVMEAKIQFRVSDEEKELIKQKAKEAGMKMSEYVRYCSLGDVELEIITNTKVIVK